MSQPKLSYRHVEHYLKFNSVLQGFESLLIPAVYGDSRGLLFEDSFKLLWRHLAAGQRSEVEFSPQVGILELQLCGHHIQPASQHAASLSGSYSASHLVDPHWRWGRCMRLKSIY